jgi:starvation-inducible DNA-binding protein
MANDAGVNIGLDVRQRDSVIGILKKVLADEYVLYTKTRNFHWNVTGPRFHDLHKFFESQYEAIDEVIDEVAERIRALGGFSTGSLKEFLADARLREHSGGPRNAGEMTSALLADHEAVIRTLRVDLAQAINEFDDAGTSDFLTGIMEGHEKTAWMLRAVSGSE